MMTTFRIRRRRQTAQTLTVAIIVLFLLLFLGGLFIALIVNNMRAGQTAAKGSAADKLAEAGIRYIDDQLTKSPEGADWRPLPFVADPGDNDGVAPPDTSYNDQDTDADGVRNAEPLRPTDPDYDWLQPCAATSGQEPCGYSRIDFGGRTPSAGNLGGRALVKLIYRPTAGDPTSYMIKLLSVGRAGIVDPSDPTTFANSEGKGQRRELTAFKSIDLVKFLRFVTNKDNRAVVASLGSTNKVQDAPYAGAGMTTRAATAPDTREVESIYHGPIHSNAPLSFNGVNRLLLDSQRGDAITTSASLSLNGVNDQTLTVTPTDPSRVFLTDVTTATTTQLLPSQSNNFTSLNGLVRDNVPQATDPLRRVTRAGVPVMDQNIGDNGLTRYRALTRESAPLDAQHAVANPITINPQTAGRLGWGTGLYLDNREDTQVPSESLIGAYSPRANWLGTDTRWWNGDNRYVPPAVVITLTPRYMMIQRSATSVNRSFLRDNTGRRINQTTVVRYTGAGAAAPTAGLPGTVRKLEGYPEGDFVIYAEGNVRIRGTVGGLDPETARYYTRHLTVVSGANIYVDGNLLKDNIAGDDIAGRPARGRSSIALLAKDYVVLNTTQFLTPGDNLAGPEASGADARAIFMRPDSPVFPLRLTQGPAEQFQPSGARFPEANPLSRIAPASLYGSNIFLRHSAAELNGATAVRLGVNNGFFTFPPALAWPNSNPVNTTLAMGGPTTVEPGVYFNHTFTLTPALLSPAFGFDNLMALSLDVSAGVPNQTDYRLSRYGIAPLDIRVEALIYAQEGSFFIIPGPWFNPDPNDTYEAFITRGFRAGDNLTATGIGRINPMFPFYGQPQDIRITIFGAIAENLPAESGDQAAWLEKWGWVPNYYGSTGLTPTVPGYAPQGNIVETAHSAHGTLPGPQVAPVTNSTVGSGILYLYDDKLASPYATDGGAPLRTDTYGNILPVAPRLPVAPGLLYMGETPGA